MKIFYINVIEQNNGWGAECFVNKGFINNGVESIVLDYRNNKNKLLEKFIEINNNFDALLLQRGDFFPIKLLKSTNRPKFFWASELVSRNWDQNRLLRSGLFSHVFVRTDECKKTILEKKWLRPEQVSILISGFDENVHKKLENVKKDIDIVFVGNVTKRRREYLDILEKKFNIKECQVFGDKMVKVFNRSKIVLNIHAEKFLDTETRIFEAIGCGSFVISEKLSMENPFKNGEHFIEVDGIEEMISKIEYFLNNQSERELIAEQGHSYGLAGHTYKIRAKYIENVINSYVEKLSGTNTPPLDLKKLKFFYFEQKLLGVYFNIYGFVWIFFRKIKNWFL